MPAPVIWHITELAAWEAAVRQGSFTRSTRDADLSERNRIAADVLDSEIERRTKIVKPFPKTVKPEERSKA